MLGQVLGPFGDAYAPDRVLSAAEAQDYHARQAGVLASAGAEILSAMTMSGTGEALGITRAAQALDIPVIVSFTVETDGNLISGQSLADAIAETDAVTGSAPVWYGINCAHPDHFRAFANSLSARHAGVTSPLAMRFATTKKACRSSTAPSSFQPVSNSSSGLW